MLDIHAQKIINQQSLKLNIAKFTGGTGSVIKLETIMDDAKPNLSYYNYVVSAAYDQGSTIAKVMKPSDALTINNFPNKVVQYIAENPILVASEIAIIPGGWITIKWWLGKRLKREYVSSMIPSLISTRKNLKNDIYSVIELRDQLLDIELGKIYVKNNIPDFILIDDLADKIERRTDYLDYRKIQYTEITVGDDKIRHPPSDEERAEIREYNEQCLTKIDEILKKIDWTKYSPL